MLPTTVFWVGKSCYWIQYKAQTLIMEWTICVENEPGPWVSHEWEN
jgi:hypothetical protein